ncbi:MAG: LemA family protein [Erysipelotrichaceae bacterium]|jgi:LemA protein|nr:LemA family protein [Erysipelotrichaceae bacterium]
MANELDELTGPVNEKGNDVNVIQKQIKVQVGWGSTLFEVLLWVLLIIPGLVFLFMKIKAKNYLQRLQQKIQHNASQIDNYLEQRVVILENAAALVNKAVKLDETTFVAIAQARAGGTMNERAEALENVASKINVSLEAYPDLKAHQEIAMAMQQNSYLQKEITAAREVYNDTVFEWNGLMFRWPTYQIVAARNGYTTRIPFSASAETKQRARQVLF